MQHDWNNGVMNACYAEFNIEKIHDAFFRDWGKFWMCNEE